MIQKKHNQNFHQPDANSTYLKNSPEKSYPFPDQISNYQRNIGLPNNIYIDNKAYIIGAGIAGLSAAYYLIRDGKIPSHNITIIDQLDITGGSMDGAGNSTEGYIIRGGREMDFTYENVWDIFQDIPALELPTPYSVLDEYRMINDLDPNYSKSRLLHKQGQVKDFSKLGLNTKDQFAIIQLLLKQKNEIDDLTIEDYFSESFLNSNFWTFWRTMFAFENWHSLLECKLYMHRFLHALDGINDLSMLVFPKYNQYDTFIKPLKEHLEEQGVNFILNMSVSDLDISDSDIDDTQIITAIITETPDGEEIITVKEDDFIFVTTGSMTEDTRYGDSNTPPDLNDLNDKSNWGQSNGWKLWNNLAQKSPAFGNPAKFNQHIDKSSWMSATLTCKPSAFIDKLKSLSVNDPYSGKTVTGGIITITDSNWLVSFTCNRQPHFPEQPDDLLVIWVYSLCMDKQGNYVKKTMPECTGHEILTELSHHLGLIDSIDDILENTIVRTAFMPYITSMFMPRSAGDRPQIIPDNYSNLGLLGQFVETRNDVVFTMEASVRTARVAVYELLDINKQVPDIYPSQYDIRHLLRAAHTLTDGEGFFGENVLRTVLTNTYYENILPPKEHKKDNLEYIHQITKRYAPKVLKNIDKVRKIIDKR